MGCFKTIAENKPSDIVSTLNFVAGSGTYPQSIQGKEKEDKTEMIREMIKDWDKTKRKLILTDFIGGGSSLLPLVQVLRSEGFRVDVVGLSKNMSKYEKYEDLGVQVIGMGKSFPSIYNKPHLSGVEKSPRKLFAERIDLIDRSLMNEAHHQALAFGRNMAKEILKSEREWE